MSYQEYINKLKAATAVGRPRLGIMDQVDLNLGASKLVPKASTLGRARAEPVRLLDLQGDSTRARNVTITMGSFLDAVQTLTTSNVSGPITGIVEWGNTATFARIEFDVPQVSRIPTDPVNFYSTTYPQSLVTTPYGCGVSLTVCGSSVRVYARNDNCLTAPLDGQVDPAATTNIIGPGCLSQSVLALAIDPTVYAHVSRGLTAGSANGLLRRTVPMCSIYPVDYTLFTCGIPAFAKRVWFSRVGSTSYFSLTAQTIAPELAITFVSNLTNTPVDAPLGSYDIPFGSEGMLNVPPGAAGIFIQRNRLVPYYTGPTEDINYRVNAIFELAL